MNKTFVLALGIGIAVMAAAVGGVLFMQRNAKVGLTGQILKVRTAPLDETSTIAVVDFRVVNPSYVVFAVRTAKLVLENNDGKQFEGQVTSEQDAKRLFEFLPILGQKFNDTLMIRDKVAGGATMDRMLAARFEAPLSLIEARKRFLVRIEEVDGTVSELSEK